MDKTGVQKLAAVLKVLVTITFVCNLLCLFLVPGLSWMREMEGTALGGIWSGASWFLRREGPITVALRVAAYFLASWGEIWWFAGMYAKVLTVFLLLCGTCTAVILWQARRVLSNILKGETFVLGNAAALHRAAVCCFVISAAAAVRTAWGLWTYRSPLSLLTYNALFVPVFLMAGLVCLVMSALFRQAAEMKAENDLTI